MKIKSLAPFPKEIDAQLQPSSIQSIYIDEANRKFILTEKGLFISENTEKFKKAISDSLNENQSYLQTMISISDSLSYDWQSQWINALQ
ncbi:MAG: hypothetical protein IPN88_09230 [Bacteroidetes bacterium]|nr:hypothetical protein [Bacteroidota bacterium]